MIKQTGGKCTYNGVEKSGLADVGEADNAGPQAHAYLGGGEAAVEREHRVSGFGENRPLEKEGKLVRKG